MGVWIENVFDGNCYSELNYAFKGLNYILLKQLYLTYILEGNKDLKINVHQCNGLDDDKSRSENLPNTLKENNNCSK